MGKMITISEELYREMVGMTDLLEKEHKSLVSQIEDMKCCIFSVVDFEYTQLIRYDYSDAYTFSKALDKLEECYDGLQLKGGELENIESYIVRLMKHNCDNLGKGKDA